MRKGHTLTFIEMTIMLLVLALVAALCLGVFAWTDDLSRVNTSRDAALMELQNTAQVFQHCEGDFEAAAALLGGSWDGSQWVLEFDAYRILVQPEQTGDPFLGSARLEARREETLLATITVHWQEVAP